MKKLIAFIFVLGISIGLIISSSINIFFLNESKSPKNSLKYVHKDKVKSVAKIEKKKSLENEVKKKDNIKIADTIKKEEFSTIYIQEGHTSNQIADILYQQGLIQNKDDFKTLLSLKTLDIYKSSEIITKKGLLSSGWKMDVLFKMMNKNYSKILDNLYIHNVVDDKDSLNYILSLVRETKRIVPGEKIIKKGSSMKEIIEIITK